MKIAIDSYCYHRYFGEVYPGLQQPPGRTMTVWDFLKRARRLGVSGVSLESCYFPSLDEDLLHRLRATLDSYGLERVWAWGHPNGLCSGTDRHRRIGDASVRRSDGLGQGARRAVEANERQWRGVPP